MAARSSRCPGRTYPGRDPLPPTGSRCPVDGRRRSRRPRPRDRAHRAARSDRGDRRRGAGAGGRAARRRAGVPVRRARDPRHRRGIARRVLRPPPPRSCRCTPGCPPPSSRRCSRLSRARARRVVLATNVAETSLTVPGIRYVVDPGTARISRYSRTHQGAAAADRTDLAGVGRAAGGPVRAHRARRVHPAVLGGRTSSPGRATPIPRSCAPTSPRSSCRWRHWASATSSSFRSSIRPMRAASATV